MRIPYSSLLLLLLCSPLAFSAPKSDPSPATAATHQETHFKGMLFRGIGPFRGGRSCAVTGVPNESATFYFGGTGGGVWRTDDGGSNWRNISDGYFGGSIGSVAVSEWDPNVLYVGGGEKTVRGNVSHGTGVWKSLDRGKTWKHMGLEDTHHIPRIRIHPKNPDLVYAAALGHLFGPNETRGVFRSKDGGETWQKILFVSEDAGAVDLLLDPTNPRIIYATFWQVRRTPYSLESGGDGSGIWKSTDGGDTWKNISTNEGLPKGTLGIIGVAVSPVNPERVWAMVEAESGGLFRSENGGNTWTRVNQDRGLRQRAWYYTRVYADTKDIDTVYVLNVQFLKSTNGGQNFSPIQTPHGDHHDLWIDPGNPNRMVIGDDGGAQVTYDGGEQWSTYHNQPTAQFYRVTTDNHFPYRIYGAQQDNSAMRIQHRSFGSAIDEEDWESTAGGESGHIAVHPENPDIVYGGSYGGFLMRLNHDNGQIALVNVWPDNPMGHGAADLKYRFQWNFPIFFSPHDSNTLYAAGNVLFKTGDGGRTWQAVSPDLTRNDKSKQGASGGPITKDNTSVEYYCTIFAAAESTHEAGVIWVGSDDGLVHVTRDGGENWENVTPKGMPEWMQINSIEIDPFNKGGAFFAGTRYKSDDFQPYLYHTTNYGKTWKKITEGLPADQFTRVVRADPNREGLLFAGTEAGLHLSFNNGGQWEPFQLNLPIVPITDMTIKDNDLVVATQGRSFWVLDDLTPLQQFSKDIAKKTLHLYEPRPAYRISGSASENPGNRGTNLPAGVLIHYYLENDPPEVKIRPENAPEGSSASNQSDSAGDAAKDVMVLEIMDSAGKVVRTYKSDAPRPAERITPRKGFNRFVWNMRYEDAESFPGMVVWSGSMTGPLAVPGRYQARISFGVRQETTSFEILADPRSDATQEDLQAQFDYLIHLRDKLTEGHRAIKRIRGIKAQIAEITKRVKSDDGLKDVVDAGKALTEKLESVEKAIYQTKNRSRQDPLNFPIRLNDKLAGLNTFGGYGNNRPTEPGIAVKDMLIGELDEWLAKLDGWLKTDLEAYNTLVAGKQLPAIWLETEAGGN